MASRPERFVEWMDNHPKLGALTGGASATSEGIRAWHRMDLQIINFMQEAWLSGAANQEVLPSLVARSSTEGLLRILADRGGAAGALGEAGLLFEQKGQDYNTGFQRDDYFPMGLQSYAQMIWVKALRLLSFAKQPRPALHEKVRDTMLDLINYAAFAADWLRRSAEKEEKP